MLRIIKEKSNILILISLALIYVLSFLDIFILRFADGDLPYPLIFIIENSIYYSGKVLLCIVILTFGGAFLLKKIISEKIVFFIGGLSGIICMLYIYFVTARQIMEERQSTLGEKPEFITGIGFYIEMALWVFILLCVLISAIGNRKEDREKEDLIEKTVAKDAKKTADNPSKKPIEKSIEKSIEKPVPRDAKKPVEQPAKKSIDKPIATSEKRSVENIKKTNR